MLNVSVVIPHFNNENQIIRAYNSVMQQTELPKEIVVVDDCSQDLSFLLDLEKIHLLLDTEVVLRVFYFEQNKGPSKARNYGVMQSTSEYIAFLDSDDAWHPQKLEISINFLDNKGVDFLFHGYLYSPPLKNIFFNKNKINILKKNKFLFAFRTYIFTPSVVLKKSIFSEFPEHLTYSEDYCCWFMSNKRNYFYYIDVPLAYGFKKPVGENGLSANISKMHKGFLQALSYLYQEKKISYSFYFIATIVEFIKYPMRYFR